MFSLDRLHSCAGEVFEPVPPQLRENYRLWRGVHLGVIAANIIERPGIRSVGAHDDVPTLFTHSYRYALGIATILAEGGTDWQWADDVHGDFLRTRGYSIPDKFPCAVVALSSDYYKYDLLEAYTTENNYRETNAHFAFEDTVTIDMLDPHSQVFLANFFTAT